jgi:hypothetical protein
MSDDQVQRSGGDALWRSVLYALQSRFVVAAGFSAACAAVIITGRSWR